MMSLVVLAYLGICILRSCDQHCLIFAKLQVMDTLLVVVVPYDHLLAAARIILTQHAVVMSKDEKLIQGTPHRCRDLGFSLGQRDLQRWLFPHCNR